MNSKEYSSFRDPSGFVFSEGGVIYRQINNSYRKQYDHLFESGLYDLLTKKELLITHEEISSLENGDYYKIIKPELVPFISYPYEWSFNQYKDAALTTLIIQKHALEHGMILKDASAFNIQFLAGSPVLLDTLSFDFYRENKPWIAYGQFCRHFLAPLYLMSKVDLRLSQMLRTNIDGIPLDLASKLLKHKGGFGALQHIHWHAKAVQKHAGDGQKTEISNKTSPKISKFNMMALIDSLIRIVNRLNYGSIKTEWMDYYNNTNYSDSAQNHKVELISEILEENDFHTMWDFGANDGKYTRLAISKGVSSVVSFDIDPVAVDTNYLDTKTRNDEVLPLVIDLTNPSPGIGFSNRERNHIGSRQKPDCIIALALIHHLAIGNNLPFNKIAEYFSGLSDNLIIEFVPKSDTQVQRMLQTRDDIFCDYTHKAFETVFKEYFSVIKKEKILHCDRIIYFFQKKGV